MHLSMAYLGQMLEKGGGFAIIIFPMGWVHCHIVTSKHPYLLVAHSCHTVHNRVFVREMVHRFVPQVWGLVPLGYVNSLLFPIEPQVLEVGNTIASYPSCVGGETSSLGMRLGIPQ